MFTIALQSIFYPAYSTNEHWDSEGSYILWLASSKITIGSQVSLILGSVVFFLLGCALNQQWKCLSGDSCVSGGKKQYQGIIWSFHKKILSVFFFFSFSIFILQFCIITKEIESGLMFCIYRAVYKYFHSSWSIRFPRVNVFSSEAYEYYAGILEKFSDK